MFEASAQCFTDMIDNRFIEATQCLNPENRISVGKFSFFKTFKRIIDLLEMCSNFSEGFFFQL